MRLFGRIFLLLLSDLPEVEGHKSLPNDEISDRLKFKAFADNKINVTEKLKFVLGKGKKHFEKRRKCWLPAFSPFPTMFSKVFSFRVIKSRDCVVKV